MRTHFTKHKIILVKQSNYDENVFCLIEQTKGNEINILIVNFLYDITLNKMKIASGKILDLLFSSNRLFKDESLTDGNNYIVNLEDKENENSNLGKKKIKLMQSIKDMFSTNKSYELMYIILDNGELLIWDYISNKSKKIVIFDCKLKKNVKLSKIIPLNTLDEDFMIILETDKIEFLILNQIIFNNIFILEKKEDLQLISDYYLDNNSNTLLLFYLSERTDSQEKLRVLNFSMAFDICSSHKIKESYQEMSLKKTKLNSYFINQTNCVQELIVNNFNQKKCKTFKINHKHNSNNIAHILSEFSDGIIRINEFHFTKKNNTIDSFKLVLKYNIKIHYNSIIDSIFLDSHSIASTANDHSLKLWNLNSCKDLNLVTDFNSNINTENIKPSIEKIVNTKTNSNNNVANTIFNKINSVCFYQQSNKNSEEFLKQFEEFYKNTDLIFPTNIEEFHLDFYIFSYINKSEENFISAEILINKEFNNCLESNSFKSFNSLLFLSQLGRKFDINFNLKGNSFENLLNEKINNLTNSSQIVNSFKYENLLEIMNLINLSKSYLDENRGLYQKLLDKFSNENFSNKLFIILLNTLLENYEEAISTCLNCNLYVEGIIIFKLTRNTNFTLYNQILAKFQKFLSQKNIFQAIKCQKVIEILNKYINKNK